MLSYDAYLWLMALPLVLGGIYFLTCETPIGTAILFDSGSIGMHVDCCCCLRCADGCTRTPRVWGTVEFSDVVDTVVVPPPNPEYACSGDSNTYCETADPGLNNTTFEVYCVALEECAYVSTSYSGTYCGLDRIRVWMYIDWFSTGTEGVLINIDDNEASVTDYAWFYNEPSYPMDCHAVQTPPFNEQGDEICDFSGATATFTPYCEEPVT